MIETLTGNLPGKQVAKGDKWDRTVNTNSGGMSLDIITNYSLNTLQGNSANVTAESNIQASPNAEPIDYGTAKVSYGELKGLGKINMVLDTKTGLLISNSSKTHVSGNLSISVQGMNMQMPMDMDIESKVVALP